MTITIADKTELVKASDTLAEEALAGKVRASITLMMSPAGVMTVMQHGFASKAELVGVLEMVAMQLRIEMLRR